MELSYEKSEKRNSGFSLIELLAVMAIILILGGLSMAVGRSAKSQAKISKTKVMIASLETALGMFQADMGGYPSSGNANMVTALTDKMGTGTYIVGGVTLNVKDNPAWAGPYMIFKQSDIVGGVLVDPWNNAYFYRNPGWGHEYDVDHSGYVDIQSAGPNGISYDTDDIGNWMR